MFSGWRLIQQILDSEETSKKFHSCSHQGIRNDLTEFGRPFDIRSDSGPCYASKEFSKFLPSSPHHQQPTLPTKQWICGSFGGISKKLMEKAVKDGKPWNYGLLEYRITPVSANLPSALEAQTGRKPRSSLPQLPSSVGNSMENSRI